MSDAQTRPPNRKGATRPPRGPRVSRPKKERTTKQERVQAVISELRDSGRPDLADKLEQLVETTPGWESRPAEGTTVPFKADRDLLARVGERRLTQVAQEGCRRFLDGELEPVRTVRGSAGQKRNTSVRIPEDLLARVTDRCEQVSPAYGWTVRPVNVFVAAFEEAAPDPSK